MFVPRPDFSRAINWRKSTRSQGENNCVEVTDEVPGWVGVRDSKLGARPSILVFPRESFARFLNGMPSGE